MPIIASVAVGQSIVRVRCSGLDRDPYIEKNIRLVDCSELSVEDNSGGPWDTHIWSIPRETLLSYAVGQPYVEPVVEVAPAPVVVEPVVVEVDPVVEAEARQRREELREADRMMLEMARKSIAARKQRLEDEEKPAKRLRRKPQPVPQAPKLVEPVAEE
jgi:hypothetical protein